MGFDARVKGKDEQIDYNHKEAQRFWLRNFIFSLLFFIPLQVIMLMPDTPFLMSELVPGLTVHETIMLIAGTLVLIIVGWPFIRSGFAALMHKSPNMDSLIFISVTYAHLPAKGLGFGGRRGILCDKHPFFLLVMNSRSGRPTSTR